MSPQSPDGAPRPHPLVGQAAHPQVGQSAPQHPTAPARSSRPEAGSGPAHTFDARRIPFKLIAGNLQGSDNAVALCFCPETKAESDRLWAALMQMREAGLFKIETAKPHAQEAAGHAENQAR